MTERHYGEVLRTPELDEMPTYKNWIRGRGPLGPRISTSEAEPDGTIPPNTTLGKSRKKKNTPENPEEAGNGNDDLLDCQFLD